eukprot:CAMPEP_0197828808 /NCGR_PEP_ID=MMETSP1437-20131217/5339_1 /TAXON_ID=49252 ORGANISM="Eucampia antarctica, Strain CCMP1452" /NCGR_SAMPLE_ID=MMETSP1437 /ASSEMBLY_ACC=CAM_ASM_001096 /LENGTH=225 /DNA_ID=CAMNT_0043430203 /DNA_START=321 /DNA_END=998 /DNA_ORIENTATION=-
MNPGDMLLYESHSVIHGRPFPLRGRYHANIFIHFEPDGHTKRHTDRLSGNLDRAGNLYRKAMRNEIQDRENCMASDGTCNKVKYSSPNYITPDSEQEVKWNQEKKYDLDPIKDKSKVNTSAATAHDAAKQGNLNILIRIGESNEEQLFSTDKNGWQPLHEAARAGHTRIIIYLIEHGADVNSRTNNGNGATPLFWAVDKFGENHSSSQALKQHGAVNIAPKVFRK